MTSGPPRVPAPMDRRRLHVGVGLALAFLVGFAPRARLAVAASGKATVAAPKPSGSTTVTETPTCPPGTFPDDGACVSLPDDQSFGEDPVGAPEGDIVAMGHFEKSGAWAAYEQIPRRPDRPADYDRYVYPIPPGLPGGKHVISGYDLDLPDALQRRGRKLRAVGHGGVDLPQKRGTPIHLVKLEHQVGDAVVLHVGTFFGTSVLTRHTLREGGRERDYVLIFGHLEGPAAGLARGQRLAEGALVGYVGDTGSPELVHLHLEARRLRDGVDGEKLVAGRVLQKDVSIVCDPRNVLPLRP